MAVIREIPIVDAPAQSFETVLGGRPVTISLRWNEWIQRWSIGLALNGVQVFAGVRCVPNVDFLKPYRLGIGKLALMQWSGAGADPGRSELPAGVFRLLHYSADV